MMFDNIYSFWMAMLILWVLGAALMSYVIGKYDKKYKANIPVNYGVSASIFWPLTLVVAAMIALARFAQKLR